MQTLSEALVRQVVQPRPKHSYKGNFGRVTIIGGNAQFGGAAIMAASAAVYAGAGLVSVVTDAVNRSALHARLPEAMILENTSPKLESLVTSQDVLVIGPGLGDDEAALQLLKRVFTAVQPEQTLIIDGSAITLIARVHLAVPTAHLIWTPHQMEWQRLSGVRIADQSPQTNAQAAANIPGVVIVKSEATEIFGEQEQYLNPVGTPAMATGGSGDTLTGIIAAFVGQFEYSDRTIGAAVYTHSAVADVVAQTHYVALPTQVIDRLPQYMAVMAQK
ncbi:NAD(P)H-hydrate dehydratase [Lacticaseibacillus porcinae]|uniref:NAD(P)H-hydrate dehydratase n=1 Tax=Lacticaseibacillus porcinae TaxID=1123687 RepID=UPI000F7B0556|nr:NAD(P)H-hydrate dehydratase [Lacticaseibacillus porcinae]